MSILKPKKPRQPLKLVNMGNSEDDEDNTEVRQRRVSFAEVNKIKEFNSEEETVVICEALAYEEKFSSSPDTLVLKNLNSFDAQPNVIPDISKEINAFGNVYEGPSLLTMGMPLIDCVQMKNQLVHDEFKGRQSGEVQPAEKGDLDVSDFSQNPMDLTGIVSTSPKPSQLHYSGLKMCEEVKSVDRSLSNMEITTMHCGKENMPGLRSVWSDSTVKDKSMLSSAAYQYHQTVGSLKNHTLLDSSCMNMSSTELIIQKRSVIESLAAPDGLLIYGSSKGNVNQSPAPKRYRLSEPLDTQMELTEIVPVNCYQNLVQSKGLETSGRVSMCGEDDINRDWLPNDMHMRFNVSQGKDSFKLKDAVNSNGKAILYSLHGHQDTMAKNSQHSIYGNASMEMDDKTEQYLIEDRSRCNNTDIGVGKATIPFTDRPSCDDMELSLVVNAQLEVANLKTIGNNISRRTSQMVDVFCEETNSAVHVRNDPLHVDQVSQVKEISRIPDFDYNEGLKDLVISTNDSSSCSDANDSKPCPTQNDSKRKLDELKKNREDIIAADTNKCRVDKVFSGDAHMIKYQQNNDTPSLIVGNNLDLNPHDGAAQTDLVDSRHSSFIEIEEMSRDPIILVATSQDIIGNESINEMYLPSDGNRTVHLNKSIPIEIEKDELVDVSVFPSDEKHLCSEIKDEQPVTVDDNVECILRNAVESNTYNPEVSFVSPAPSPSKPPEEVEIKKSDFNKSILEFYNHVSTTPDVIDESSTMNTIRVNTISSNTTLRDQRLPGEVMSPLQRYNKKFMEDLGYDFHNQFTQWTKSLFNRSLHLHIKVPAKEQFSLETSLLQANLEFSNFKHPNNSINKALKFCSDEIIERVTKGKILETYKSLRDSERVLSVIISEILRIMPFYDSLLDLLLAIPSDIIDSRLEFSVPDFVNRRIFTIQINIKNWDSLSPNDISVVTLFGPSVRLEQVRRIFALTFPSRERLYSFACSLRQLL